MSTYSIKDLEKLSGIKAHTIRIWEQRYHLIEPQRTSTNIRYYTDDDLVKLMNTSLLNKGGYKISRIAELDKNQISKLILQLNDEEPSLVAYSSKLTKALLNVDEIMFNDVFDTSVKNLGFEGTVEHLLFPFLENIGTLWLSGTIIPAQEHFITNLIRQKLIAAIDKEQISTGKSLLRILFYLPEGEFHEIGMLYYSYLARIANIEVIYLGTSVPFRDIVKINFIRPFQVIFTSFVISQGEGTLAKRMERKRKAFPDKIFLVSGWQIKTEQPHLPKNFFQISSASDFKKALKYIFKKETRKSETKNSQMT